MIIQHFTGQFFKISQGDFTLVYNPPAKNSGLLNKSKSSQANVVISSVDHPYFNGFELYKAPADKKLIQIKDPGEYEVSSVFVHGEATESSYPKQDHLGEEKLINKVYAVTLEGVNLIFLGALPSKDKMNYEITEEISSVDVLFVPIGGGDVLNPQEAYSLAVSMEAKIIIPMHFSGIGSDSALGEFLKEAGAESTHSVEKLSLKKKDIEGKNAEVVIIQS